MSEYFKHIVLKIQGVGEIPSFKNSKMIARGRLITDPRKQKIMERITRSFEFQLRSLSQTTEAGTGTAHIPPSKIVSFMPLDDSLDWIPEHSVKLQRVSKEQAGAIVTIERLC